MATTDRIDSMVSTDSNPYELKLRQCMKKYMVYRKCGKFNPKAPCMINGLCKHRFPKPANKETTIS